jgi:SnoaL-like protein
MRLDLPKPIAEYFAAENTRDADALARCFVADGVVHDEGGSFYGTAAIRDWNAAAREKYHHTVTPLSAVDRDGTTIVAGRVAGDFPGSPVTLDHIFRLKGDKIASLEIR